MKPIHNKNKYECGCSIAPRRKKNGRMLRQTEAEKEKIYALYEKYYNMCNVDKEGNCKEEGYHGHTKIGVFFGTLCPKCNHQKTTFISHRKYKFDERERIPNGYNTLHLPPPRLRMVTEESIITQNEALEDGYFDDLDTDYFEN